MSLQSQGCAFCEIVAGRAPAHVVEEDELSSCLLDINPFTEGHCLVISKRHVPWWHDLSEEEIVSLFRMARRVANRLRDAFSPEFVCLYARGRRSPTLMSFWYQPGRATSWTASSTPWRGFRNRHRRWRL